MSGPARRCHAGRGLFWGMGMVDGIEEDTRRLTPAQSPFESAPRKWMVPLMLIAAVGFVAFDAFQWLARRLPLGRRKSKG